MQAQTPISDSGFNETLPGTALKRSFSESASAHSIAQKLISLSACILRAKRQLKRYTMQYEEFWSLLCTVNDLLEKSTDEEEETLKDACYILGTTLKALTLQKEDYAYRAKEFLELLSHDLLSSGFLFLHEAFFLKVNAKNCIRNYLNLISAFLRYRESERVTAHAREILARARGIKYEFLFAHKTLVAGS